MRCLALGISFGAIAPAQAQGENATPAPAVQNAPVSPGVQIVSASDGAVVGSAAAGKLERVSARAGQSFKVTLQYPADMAGGEVALDPLDGGKIDARAHRKAKIGADGSLAFVFTAGQNPGSYQVELRSDRGAANLSFVVEAAPAQ